MKRCPYCGRECEEAAADCDGCGLGLGKGAASSKPFTGSQLKLLSGICGAIFFVSLAALLIGAVSFGPGQGGLAAGTTMVLIIIVLGSGRLSIQLFEKSRTRDARPNSHESRR
jgi:hypothetical protein